MMEASPARIAFLFPGQGSQVPGMGKELSETYPAARQTFLQADDILSLALSSLAWEGPEEDLNDTINTQPALLVHSVAAWRVLRERLPELHPMYLAGHSMGELSALVAAGALPYPEALRLVRRRGELMKEAGRRSPGGMAAVLGLDLSTLDRICAEASQGDEIVQVANDNCPGQVVISGASPALQRAMEQARAAGARKVVQLAVSIAAHSPLMQHAQADFNRAVDSAPISDPNPPILGNVSARPLNTSATIRADLQAQLNSRVRWTESIQYMIAQGVDTFLELGSESVLTGLLKRIDRNVKAISLGKPQDFDSLLS